LLADRVQADVKIISYGWN